MDYYTVCEKHGGSYGPTCEKCEILTLRENLDKACRVIERLLEVPPGVLSPTVEGIRKQEHGEGRRFLRSLNYQWRSDNGTG